MFYNELIGGYAHIAQEIYFTVETSDKEVTWCMRRDRRHHKMQHRALLVLEYYLYFRASRGVRDPKPRSHTPSNTH